MAISQTKRRPTKYALDRLAAWAGVVTFIQCCLAVDGSVFRRRQLTQAVSQPLLAEVIVPRKIEITCDHCGKDLLTISSAWNEYRLHLATEEIHNTSNTRYPERRYPPVDDCFFCGISCLESWLTNREAL